MNAVHNDNTSTRRGSNDRPPPARRSRSSSALPRARTSESDSNPPSHGADVAGRERSSPRRANADIEIDAGSDETKIELGSNDEDEGQMAHMTQTPTARHQRQDQVQTRTNESGWLPPAREHHGDDVAGLGRSPPRHAGANTENEDEIEEMKVELGSGDEDEGPMASVEQTQAANQQDQKPKGWVEAVEGGETPRSDDYAALMHEAEDEGNKRENAAGINLPQVTAQSTVPAQPMSPGQLPSAAVSSRAPMSPPSPSQRTPSRPQQAVGGHEAASGRANRAQPATAAAVFSRVPTPSSRPAPAPNSAPSPPSDEENAQPPPTLEATLVDDATVYVATCVSNVERNEPTPVTADNRPEDTRITNVEGADDPWWNRYKITIIVGVAALLIGAMASAIGMLAGRGTDGAGGDAPPSQETLLTTPATSPPAFMFSARPSPQLSMNVNGPTSKVASLDPTPRPSLRPSVRPTEWPVAVIVTPTPKPSLSPMTQLQSSVLELVPDEEIVSHFSDKNVAIHGSTAVVGAPTNDDERGFVLVYVKDDNDKWMQQAKLVAPDGTAGDQFGYSVGIHGDTIAIGAYKDDDNGRYSGSAHVFIREGVIWTHLSKLIAPDGAAGDWFGRCVGIYDDTVIIGAYGDDDNGESSGSAHLFAWNGNAWTHQAKLVAPDGAAGDYFGASVGIFGDTAVVGASADADNGSSNGSAYLFVRNNDAWTYQAKLLAPDGAADDYFGSSVAIFGDTVVIGAFWDDDNGTDSGSAYLFACINDTWMYQAKLKAPDGAANDRFGLSVGIYDDVVIVGSDGDDDIEMDRGSAHAFVRNGVTWTHHAKLVAPRTGKWFGRSLGIYNDTIISGSYSGEVYVFLE